MTVKTTASQFTSGHLYDTGTPFDLSKIGAEDRAELIRDRFYVIGKVSQDGEKIDIHIDDTAPVVIDNAGTKEKLVAQYPELTGQLNALPTLGQVIKREIPELADYQLISAEVMPWVVYPDNKVELMLVQRPDKPIPYPAHWNAPAGRMDGTLGNTAAAEFTEEMLALVVGQGGQVLQAVVRDFNIDLAAVRSAQFVLNAEKLSAAGIEPGRFNKVEMEYQDMPWETTACVGIFRSDALVEHQLMTAFWDKPNNVWQLRKSAFLMLEKGESVLVLPGEAKSPEAAAVNPDEFMSGNKDVVPTTREYLEKHWPGQQKAQQMVYARFR